MHATLYLMLSEMESQCGLFQERCRLVMTRCHEDESCSKVLNFLERLDNSGCSLPFASDLLSFVHMAV